METLDHKVGYLFFTRHGERADDKKVKETDRIKFSGDPPLSKRGFGELEPHGATMNNYIRSDLGYLGGITLVSSPFIRTLQTAAAFCSCLENSIVCYDTDKKTVIENTCLVNPSIGLGLTKGNFKADPASKFLYKTMDHKKLLKEYCNNQFVLATDHNMTVKAPKYPETKHKSRYREAFLDIAKQHFVNDKNFKLGDTKVVMMFSHSDGYTPFLQLFDKNLESGKPCYGATSVIKYIIDSEGKMTADSLNNIIE